jgi:hypothetical protein
MTGIHTLYSPPHDHLMNLISVLHLQTLDPCQLNPRYPYRINHVRIVTRHLTARPHDETAATRQPDRHQSGEGRAEPHPNEVRVASQVAKYDYADIEIEFGSVVS